MGKVSIHFKPIRDEHGESLVHREADGHIGGDGRFELGTPMRGEGALRGRYRVTQCQISGKVKKNSDVPTTPSQVTIDGPRGDLVFELDK